MFSKVLCVVSIVISCGVLNVSSLDLNITGFSLEYLNEEYVVETATMVTIDTENNGLTKVAVEWEVLKAFPEDVTIKTTIVRFDTPDETKGRFFKVEASLCDLNDPLRPYLSPFLVQITESGNCVQPGTYTTADAGQFQFDKYLRPEDIDGAAGFKAYNTIESSNVLIKKFELSSVLV